MLQNSTVFTAQNAGNRISELLDFKFFWGGGGGHAPRPPRERGLAAPLVVIAAYYICSAHL